MAIAIGTVAAGGAATNGTAIIAAGMTIMIEGTDGDVVSIAGGITDLQRSCTPET